MTAKIIGGKGGSSSDFGGIMKVLMHDNELLDDMLVTDNSRTVNNLLDKYFCETANSEVLTKDMICRVVLSRDPQLSTNNIYVKRDIIAINIFVPNLSPYNYDRQNVIDFERRIDIIADRIIKLLNYKKISNSFNKTTLSNIIPHLINKRELVSGTPGYARMFLQFVYKRIYD